MPFDSSGGAVYRSAARYATTVAADKIQAINYFTLVSPSAVNDARRRGESIENYVDALFYGQIILIEDKTTPNQGQYKNKDGTTVTYTYYVREVEVEFNYLLERARDGTLIGPISRRGSASDNQESISSLASVNTLVNRVIDDQLKNLNRDVVPYTIVVYRSLEKEKNKDLKPQMDAALAQVKGGYYTAARQAYLAVWESYQSVAAAVNASILYEALGETSSAAKFMQQVFAVTGSPLAGNTLNRLNMELAQQARVEQFDNTKSPVERVAGLAINEVQNVLPANPRLWIYNNAAANQNLANDIIDNMIFTFIKNGVSVVERQMIDMVLSEQNFQLSGNVSDDEIVSIGNLAGANTVVIAGITGAGAARRFHIRVLDIRTGTVIMQSGTGSEWNL